MALLDLFFIQAGITLLVWIVLEVIFFFPQKISKFWKKNLKKRKKFFTFFALFFLFLGWAHLEKIFSSTTEIILCSVLTLSFWGLFIHSTYKIFTDHTRIQRAIARREAREK